jgi:putative oxidoreductase
MVSLFEKSDTVFAFFRIAVALLFLQHGLQKIFGLLGGINGQGLQAPLFSLPWWAGSIEIIVGVGLALGIFIRPLSFLGAAEMLAAYFIAHASQDIFPIINRGELALLYFLSFILLMFYAPRTYSISDVFQTNKRRQG